MPTNTNLTKETAIKLIKSREVMCPACGGAKLTPRYAHKSQNVLYKCEKCGEVYRPYKLI